MKIYQSTLQSAAVILLAASGTISNIEAQAQTANPAGGQRLFNLAQPPKTPPVKTAAAPVVSSNVRIRIGIARKNWAASEAQVAAADVKLKTMLSGTENDIYDAVILEQKIPQLMLGEAREKNCNYILYIEDFASDIGVNRGGNFLTNGITHVVSSTVDAAGRTIVGNLPYSPTNGTQQIANAATVSAVSQFNVNEVLNGISFATKKKNKVTISYTLYSFAANQDLATKTVKSQTAARDKDNILERVLIDIGSDVLNLIPVNA